MAKLSLLEKIFSITNKGIFKVITILGFSIKIDQTQKYKKICKALSINKNKIVFENFKGNSYGCNPKYITEEIIKRKLPYELVWIVKSVTKEKEMGNWKYNCIGKCPPLQRSLRGNYTLLSIT